MAVWIGLLVTDGSSKRQTDLVSDEDWTDALAAYAERLHGVAGPDHHVVSALGAWLLVALCAPLAENADYAELAEVLGADPMEAAQFAAELLTQPHPLVASGAGMWMAPAVTTPVTERWLDGLPRGVTTGDIPPQEDLDVWTKERTLGLIDRFSIRIDPDVVCLLATALATKVSWDVPFELVDAAALAPSPWVGSLGRVLRSPRQDPRHRQYVTETDRAGTVGVHLAGARGGLLVGSVIAVDPEVRPADVLAAAHSIATSEARAPHSVARRSLFDLPLGNGAIWAITEKEVETKATDGREEVVTAVLPAWSAETTVDLDREDLGLPTAARTIKKALELTNLTYEATQTAVARYTAVGFEAAAVTGLAIATSAPQLRPGYRREATLHFGHPYAVVAVACNDRGVPPRDRLSSPWHGLPVFSAWISKPSEAESAAG
jgi:hypothetical protein